MEQRVVAQVDFQEMVKPELSLLLRMAVRITGNTFDAEDLVQDTLVRAFRAYGGFDGKFPRAWLMTILRNTHLNSIRVKRPLLIEDWTFLDSSEDIGVESGFSSELIEAFKQLDQEFREVIYFVEIEGMSYQECSALLGIKVGTVTSRLSRSRQKLREYLITARESERQ